MGEDIKELHGKINNRVVLVDKIAKATGATKINILSNWLQDYKGFPVPKKHKTKVIQIMRDQVKNQ